MCGEAPVGSADEEMQVDGASVDEEMPVDGACEKDTHNTKLSAFDLLLAAWLGLASCFFFDCCFRVSERRAPNREN